jgi:hypothetical protein
MRRLVAPKDDGQADHALAPDYADFNLVLTVLNRDLGAETGFYKNDMLDWRIGRNKLCTKCEFDGLQLTLEHFKLRDGKTREQMILIGSHETLASLGQEHSFSQSFAP